MGDRTVRVGARLGPNRVDDPATDDPAVDDPAAEDGARHGSYLPALDGLRALAVGAVLLFHGGFRWAKGGFLGVSVFFTLSGFLITTLLLRERDGTGTISLRRFWARRARRLLPAALVCLAAVAIVDWRGLIPHRSATRVDLLGALVNVANWRFYFSGQSYGSLFRTPSPVQHYWSLAIEEQFYLVLPMLAWLLAARRQCSRRRLLQLAVIAYLGFTALTIVTGWHDPDLAYYATFARAPELLAGVCLALALPSRAIAAGSAGTQADEPSALVIARWSLTAAGFAALTQFAALVATVDQRGQWLSRGGLCAFALLSTVLVIAALFAAPVRALLSLRPLPWIGRLSYGIYLYHWPVFLVLSPTRLGWSRWSLFALRVPVTVAVAVVSYYLVEQPIRARRTRLARLPRLALPVAGLATAAVAVLLTGPVSITDQVLAARVVSTAPEHRDPAPPNRFAAPTTGNETAGNDSIAEETTGAATNSVSATADPSATVTTATVTTATSASAAPASAAAAARPRPVRILVAGDSTAEAVAPGLTAWAADTGAGSIVSDAIRVGCGFVTSGRDRYGAEPRDIGPVCGQVQSQVESVAATSKADIAVIFDGVWEVTDHQAPGDIWRSPGDVLFDRRLQIALHDVTTKVLAHVPKVVWATSPTIHPGWGFAGDDPAWEPTRMTHYNELLTAMAAEFGDRVVVLDYAKWMNDGPNGMNPDLRPDGVHASAAGARVVADWVGPRLVATANAAG